MGKLFGTDGVRGVAYEELTCELARKLGAAGTHVLGETSDKPVIVIGRDTRESGLDLYTALAEGITKKGGSVINVGVIPTPAVAFLTRHYNAACGIVVSASHNSFEYNGIKFFNYEGYKLPDKVEDEITEIVLNSTETDLGEGEPLNAIDKSEEALQVFVEKLVASADFRLEGFRVALDCAHGASYKAAEMVYKALGAEVFVMGNEPDGKNINRGVGSTHPEKLAEFVLENKANIGLAFDGDADRLIVVDEKGRVVDGDKTIAICAKMLKLEGKLKHDRVAVTVMSNIGFTKAMDEIFVTVDKTNVGDRYVLESMRETGAIIGGEQSGHIIFLEHNTTGDGIMSSLQVVRAVLKSGKTMSALSDEIMIYPQVLVNAKIDNKFKKTFTNDKVVSDEIARIECLMAESGRVLIRPSGTEPLVRVMIEGKNVDEITCLAKGLASLIEERFPLEG